MNTYDKPSASWLKDPWLYVALTFAWTWAFWGLGILLNINIESPLGLTVALLGVIGPLVTGLSFTYLTKNKAGRRDYWRRVVDVKRVGLKWFLIVLLFVPVLNGLSALIDLALGGTGAVWGKSLVNVTSNPMPLVLSVLFASLVPFIEELGWRGYALDRFQERQSAFASSLSIGVAWSLWHLPLFFVEGTYQAGLGVGTQAFWLFMVGVVPLSFAFTWVYNNTGRSILAAFMLHAMVNFTGEMFDIVGRANTISIALWVLVAVAITVIWGPATFTRHPLSKTAGPLPRGTSS